MRYLEFRYTNDAGNTSVTRSYYNYGDRVVEVENEKMYNFVEEHWENTLHFVREYELADDGETLVGDGSNWQGTGRKWDEWFAERHDERLALRFPHDHIPKTTPSVEVVA